MFELPKNSIIFKFGDTFWITTGAFDEGFERSFYKCVDFCIVIVVVSYAEQGLTIVPNGSSEPRSIHLRPMEFILIVIVLSHKKFYIT